MHKEYEWRSGSPAHAQRCLKLRTPDFQDQLPKIVDLEQDGLHFTHCTSIAHSWFTCVDDENARAAAWPSWGNTERDKLNIMNFTILITFALHSYNATSFLHQRQRSTATLLVLYRTLLAFSPSAHMPRPRLTAPAFSGLHNYFDKLC